jgi:hypothetical protein
MGKRVVLTFAGRALEESRCPLEPKDTTVDLISDLLGGPYQAISRYSTVAALH